MQNDLACFLLEAWTANLLMILSLSIFRMSWALLWVFIGNMVVRGGTRDMFLTYPKIFKVFWIVCLHKWCWVRRNGQKTWCWKHTSRFYCSSTSRAWSCVMVDDKQSILQRCRHYREGINCPWPTYVIYSCIDCITP